MIDALYPHEQIIEFVRNNMWFCMAAFILSALLIENIILCIQLDHMNRVLDHILINLGQP